MAQKLTLSAADLSRELGMPEQVIGEILPASQQATFPDRAAFDTLRNEIAGQPTDADKRLALRRALDEKRFTVEAAVQDAAGTERGMLGVTAEARRDAKKLGAAVVAGATAIAHGDVRGARAAISHATAAPTSASAGVAPGTASENAPVAAPAATPAAAWEKVSNSAAQLATHLGMSFREITDVLGIESAQRVVFADQAAYEALRAEMTGKSIIEKRTILRKAHEEKRFSIQAANSPAPTKAAEAKADLLAAADAAKRGDRAGAIGALTEAAENATGMTTGPIDMQEVAKGYQEGGAMGAIFGLMGSLFHSVFGKLLGSLSALAGLFGGGKSKEDNQPAEPAPASDKPAPAPEKPFVPMKEENFAQYAKRMADDLEKKIGVKLDAAKRKKLEEEILPKYKAEIGDVTAEVIAKQEINLAMVFKTPVIMLGFMSDLVSNDIVKPEVIAMNYLEDGSDMMMLGLRAAGSALGAGSLFGIEFGTFSADSIAQAISTKMHGASPEEQGVLARIFCHQGGIVASLIGGLGAGLGRMLLGFSSLQNGLPSELRTTSAAFFGRQQTLADELGKIATALEPSGVTPAYVTDLQKAVKSTAAQIQFTQLWHDTMKNGNQTQADLQALSAKVDTLRTDPLYKSSDYLDAVQARVKTLAANGLPPEMKGLDDLARDIAKTGLQHTPKATVVHFQERMANSVLRNFADAQVNSRLLMNELATVSLGLDARLSSSNAVERAFKNMADAVRVERLPGQARETIYAIDRANVEKWNQNAKIVALQAPDLFRSFMRGAGVIAITGMSAATADEKHSFLGNLATNMAWTMRFGPLAFAVCDLEQYGLDLKNGSFTGMAELALITAQTAMDVTAGAKFAAKTLIRGQWNMGTLGQFGRFMAPVAFDAVELGSAGIRTGLAARDLLSGAGRATAAEAAVAETGLLSRAGAASRGAVSALARATTGAAADTLAVLRGTAPFSAMRAVGLAGTVLTAVLMAKDAYAFVDGKLDQKKLEGTVEMLKADGVIGADGNINYEKAGYMIRTADATKFPPDAKKRFCELVVFGMLDASLKIDPNNPKEVTDNRKYEVNVTPSDLHKRDQDVSYMNLYGVPFQVKHSGDKVTVTFMNGPVHPHEQQRIIYAFNAMGMDAEVKMDQNAQVRYKNMWSEYLDEKNFLDNNWLAEQAKARGIPSLADGKPDRAKFIESCRYEYMILTGITDPKSTEIPLEIRQTV